MDKKLDFKGPINSFISSDGKYMVRVESSKDLKFYYSEDTIKELFETDSVPKSWEDFRSQILNK